MSDISLSKAVRTNLLSLQSTATMMATTQERLATGNKVNSALDNPTNFFTASSLNSRASDMSNLMDSMANGIKTLEAADNGLTAITKSLESMQSTLRQARQDKSFQAASFEVGADSTLKINGGQFGAETEIKLQAPSGGSKASISGDAAYNGPTITAVTADADSEGAGARSVIELDGATNLAGKTIKVDGKTVSFAASDNTVALAAAKLNSVLGTTDYTVTQGTGGDANKIVIENKKVTGYASTSPVVDLGMSAATKASASFVFDSTKLGSSVAVDGTDVVVGGTATDFAANMQKTLDDANTADPVNNAKYKVSLDSATSTITVTNEAAGAGNVVLSGAAFTGTTATPETSTALASGTVATDANIQSLSGAIVTLTAADGTDLDVTISGSTTLTDFAASGFTAAFDAAGGLNFTRADGQKFTVEIGGTGAAAAATALGYDGADTTAANSNSDGVEAVAPSVTVTQVSGVAGTTAAATAAASDEISVVYDNKTANIKVTGANSSGDRSTIAKSINDQLKAAGMENLEATFDTDGKLSIASKEAEGKALSITGAQADTILGAATAKTSTGEAAISAYTSSTTVDKFVEEVNRSYAGSLRASNDNGKLRIENLSTQQLDVSFDKDGAGVGAAASSSISGNSVRESLSKQFNELRDQLDKLSDDASFNGVNLLRGDNLQITFNETGTSSIEIQSKNGASLNAASMELTDIIASDLDSDTSIDAMLDKVKTALNSVRAQSSAFGSNLSVVQNRQDFTKSMIDTLETGAANLTLADMNAEAANMLALQTRQSLASSTLSMANQADQSILQLLR